MVRMRSWKLYSYCLKLRLWLGMDGRSWVEDQVTGAEEFQKLRGQEIGRILGVNNEIRKNHDRDHGGRMEGQ